ncbi:MAG: hypoxanthine-guanine phosphoribosyltransferase [Pseudomonadales bacterium]|nr:hypoxanthine-guanine phosphoribosyltransferase [Pseudomonadales bacterium]
MGEITPEEIVKVTERADCLHSEKEVEAAIDDLARQISDKVATKNPLLICVMNGGLILTGKLATRLQFPLQLDYIHATRYRGETSGADLQWKNYPAHSLEGRVVVVIDDILDEGATLESIVNYCQEQNTQAVYTAVLVDKVHDRKLTDLKADFVGLEVEDRYLYGYGMDYKGYLRNAAGIFAVADSDK